MTYNIEGNKMLFSIDRTTIIDISADDVIQVTGFPGAVHRWSEHDTEFVENNPDDEIFLQVERIGQNSFKALGIVLREDIS
jgi:hypothetical protein